MALTAHLPSSSPWNNLWKTTQEASVIPRLILARTVGMVAAMEHMRKLDEVKNGADPNLIDVEMLLAQNDAEDIQRQAFGRIGIYGLCYVDPGVLHLDETKYADGMIVSTYLNAEAVDSSSPALITKTQGGTLIGDPSSKAVAIPTSRQEIEFGDMLAVIQSVRQLEEINALLRLEYNL